MDEIELKYLMAGFPKNITPFLEAGVDQFYLCTNPEVRFREMIKDGKSATYKQTIKSNGDLCRREIEFNITKEIYYNTLDLISKPPIRKVYKKYKLSDGSEFEVSLVDNVFYYGEIEFSTVKEAEEWVMPLEIQPWIVKDVTYNSSYKMKNYWIQTRG